MITDINNEPITPGQYKYWLRGWSRYVKFTIEERDGVLYISRSSTDVHVHPTMLKDVRSNAILERIED